MTDRFVDDVAELGSEEEEDDDFNDDNRGRRQKNSRMNGNDVDSSEEDEDEDDDEEAAAAIREGFIVDDQDDDEDRDARRERRKRKREKREEDEEALDEDDLDLLAENDPEFEQQRQTANKRKRLKQRHKEDRVAHEHRAVADIFDDDEEDDHDGYDDNRHIGRSHGGVREDDLGDFIEEDEFEDDIEQALKEDHEVARPGAKGLLALTGGHADLDEATLEDMQNAFGTGYEYEWALEKQAQMDEEEQGGEQELELKDVFEPSQLKEKMLTDEDNVIRMKDVPERYQLARKIFKEVELSEEEAMDRIKEEAAWISNMLLPKKTILSSYYHKPLEQSVEKVLEFMNIEDYEAPFIFQHRKDYLIHAVNASEIDQDDPDAPPPGAGPVRLLNQNDLWDIFDLDLKFRGLMEKRDALQKAYNNLKATANVFDSVIEEMVPDAATVEEMQDIQDYLHFQYSAELKDINLMDSEANGTQKRAQSSKSLFEKLRASKIYNMVRSFGITADSVAQNALTSGGSRRYAEDPSERPDDMADQLLDPPTYERGDEVLRAARAMYIEEMFMSPRMRKLLRQQFYRTGMVDCFRTEKGLRKINDDHPYYEFKYLRGQDFRMIAEKPEMFLRMLKAEEEGLVEVRIRLDGFDSFKQRLYQYIESDNISEVADAWNTLRREALDSALLKLITHLVRGVKESVKAECEVAVGHACREKYSARLDQAPYKPKGMILGTPAKVLALSNGQGVHKRDAVCWAFLEDDGRVVETGKFVDLRTGSSEKNHSDGHDVPAFRDLIERRKPDVIGVSGFSVETKRLLKDIQDIVEKHDLRGAEYEDEDGKETSDKLEVVVVNDEVARLYHTSDRAATDHPDLPPLTRYCVALARYIQSPLKEYAALGKDIISISFDPNQTLLSKDKLLKYLDTAMVDMVNLVGVDINDAVANTYTGNLLPYVCGLGPRKAHQLIKSINHNGGVVNSRLELLGDPDKRMISAVGPKVYVNCASFLWIEYDSGDPESDYLDNTRVHPEDYELGRKMAADALELDEEDVKAEIDEGNEGAVVRKLIREDAQDKVNELVLEEYAEQLEQKFNQRKRATLETIRAELQTPYEELRHQFMYLTTDEIFTMLTGETRDSLVEGMIVPVLVRRVFPDHIEVKLDCGIDGGISESDYPDGVGGDRGVDPRSVFSTGQTLRSKILFVNRKGLSTTLSLREDVLRRPFQKEINRLPREWDIEQEEADKKSLEKEKEQVSGRAQRVVNHPLFFSFNSAQAEEYLGSKEPGSVVIRPSSKGLDHLAVTWKIADNVFQHVDVLELDKENEFSLGKTLKIAGKYTYSDLDELIVNHIEAMSKKVAEMMKDERFNKGSRAATEDWLGVYTKANPKRSMYAFCINPKYPGYFHLCFKAGQNAPIGAWPVKIVPNAYELQKISYPDMRALKNGFKTLFQNKIPMR